MKKKTPPEDGKLIVHGDGAGVLGRSDVAKRAEENAEIAGRATPTEEDRRQAEVELNGGNLPPTGDVDSDSRRTITRDPSDPAPSIPVEKPAMEAPDEQKAAERLVLEGVEEAQHEQMLAARRKKAS